MKIKDMKSGDTIGIDKNQNPFRAVLKATTQRAWDTETAVAKLYRMIESLLPALPEDALPAGSLTPRDRARATMAAAEAVLSSLSNIETDTRMMLEAFDRAGDRVPKMDPYEPKTGPHEN